MNSYCYALLVGCLVTVPVHGQNDSGPEGSAPLVQWRFDGATEPGGVRGRSSEPGPRLPNYPTFPATNAARTFTSPASVITVREGELPGVALRFGKGEAITLEAWVKVATLKKGSYAYLIGKGRSRRPGFPEKNQNYALRLQGDGASARVSFLFASAAAPGKPSDWHRWTTRTGFPLQGWHHVAVSYNFGTPGSIRGYIDGKSVPGTWDMGGATDRAPVADADDLIVGTGNGGGPSNSFRGWLDDVAIHRHALSDSILATRYQFVPPAPAIERKQLLPGKVLVQICHEGMPGHNAWPDLAPPATQSYDEEAFGFFALPHHYIDTGIREDRPNPHLFRAAAVVRLPAGKHRLLLRARGAARLYVEDRLLLTTPFPPQDSSGHGAIRKADSYLNLGPDFRFAPPGNRESWITLESPGKEHLIVLETIVGGYIGKTRRRPELGETVVAWSREGAQTWHLLAPGNRVVPYTDAGWTAYEAERGDRLDRLDAAARVAARERSRPYWDRRRQAAREWLARTVEVPVPALPAGYPGHNAIDAFLGARLARVVAESPGKAPGSVDFVTEVQPVLAARCHGCHAGGKVKGGLRLDERQAALRGGTSDGPAIVPGKPEKSALLARIRSHEATERMPPRGERLTIAEVRTLETWIREGAHWPQTQVARGKLTRSIDDLTYLRRVTLDTVGVVPSVQEIERFLADPPEKRRNLALDRLLRDDRWADQWMGYWQDVLAENPNILNPTLNNTGPFRWWLHESLRDNKPMDLFVTELVRMKGSTRFGGPAGFAVASQNDAPLAAKGLILSGAFLGVEMKCARCHDAPAHQSTQQDLFQLAAMLGSKTQTLPATSSVPLERIPGGRAPLIRVSLKPGSTIEPRWPFPGFVSEQVGRDLAEHPEDSRDRLAAAITAPANERFAQVIVNRVWKRYLGRGLVEPVEDWEKEKPSHPELLRWLGRELVRSGYDVKHLARLILESHVYQRATDRAAKEPDPLFAAPASRRLEAEQIVDSLFAATGKPFRLEEVSLDIDGQRDLGNSITLGTPRRAWMLTSTSNERDRPSLALPRIQAVTDVLQAFGWRGARQEPTSAREAGANVLQPAILSNGTMGGWLTRLSDDHAVTALALEPRTVEQFLDALFLRLLTRYPTSQERNAYREYLKEGYAQRVRQGGTARAKRRVPEPYVTWSNHLDAEATLVRQRQEEAARQGDPATERLEPGWRARLEDVVWALVNSTEFVFAP